jgi:thiol-disulfide isomerase/thioredoxin
MEYSSLVRNSLRLFNLKGRDKASADKLIMEKLNRLLLCLILPFSTGVMSCAARVAVKTTISGQIKGMKNGVLRLVLEEDINRKKNKVLADIPIDENGRFTIERDLAPHIYTLKFGDTRSVMLAVGNGQKIFVIGDISGPAQWQITGSDDTTKLQAYEEFRKDSLNRLVIPIREQIKELKKTGVSDTDPRQAELAGLEIANYAKHKEELIEFIKREMGTSLAIYPTSIRWDGEKNIPFLRDLSKRFQNAYPGTDIAAKVNEKVETIAANSVGGTAAEIHMPDKNGVVVSLSSIKAKYILIDFWGSWCAPCRGESRHLNEVYRKFRPLGFEIYGVGLESSKDLWLRAIEQDKRQWTNVTSLQEFEAPVTFDYAVTSLPANVLIDDARKVVSRNLHGKDLQDLLERLFANKD